MGGRALRHLVPAPPVRVRSRSGRLRLNMKIQSIASVISISLALGLVTQASAAEFADVPKADGFYGGVSMRDSVSGGSGVNFGSASTIGLTRYPTVVGDDSTTRSLAYGGYRWSN